MTGGEDLIAECRRRIPLGLEVPVVVRRKSPPAGRRVRVAPGVMGEIANAQEGRDEAGRVVWRVVCYVDPAALLRALGA